MKITKKQLRKLIKEAIFFPPNTKPEDIEYGNQLRKILSPDQIKKADELAKDDPEVALTLGGFPEDKPDIPVMNIPIESTTFEYYKDYLDLTDLPMFIDEILSDLWIPDEITVDKFFTILKDEYNIDHKFLIDSITIVGSPKQKYSSVTPQLYKKIIKEYIKNYIEEQASDDMNVDIYNNIIYKKEDMTDYDSEY